MLGPLRAENLQVTDPLCPYLHSTATATPTRPSSETSSAGVWCVGLRFSVTPPSRCPRGSRRRPFVGFVLASKSLGWSHRRTIDLTNWSRSVSGHPGAGVSIFLLVDGLLWDVHQPIGKYMYQSCELSHWSIRVAHMWILLGTEIQQRVATQ